MRRLLLGASLVVVACLAALVAFLVGRTARYSARAPDSAAVRQAGVSPHDSDGFKLIAQTIRELHPGAIVTPYLVAGSTDSRPILVKDGTLSLMHGTNERVSVENHIDAVRFYTRLIEASAR